MARRKRGKFATEFKAEGRTRGASGRPQHPANCCEPGPDRIGAPNWLKLSEVDAGEGPPDALTTAEKSELSDLRCEVKRLR